MTKIRYTRPDGQSSRIPPEAFVRNIVRDEPGMTRGKAMWMIRDARGLPASRETRRLAGRIIANTIRLGRIRMEDDRLYPVEEDQEEEA